MVRRRQRLLASLLLLAVAAGASAQTLYKFRGENGEWIYTDRKPPSDTEVETRALSSSFSKPSFSVTHTFAGRSIELTGVNRFFAPIEVRLEFNEIIGVQYPHPDQALSWVVPPRSELTLLSLAVLGDVAAPYVDYGYQYLPGDPAANHAPVSAYQAPFTVGAEFPITQSFPESITHRSLDSRHAVDLAMPIGTDVLAARGGIVFDVASENFRGGMSMERNGDEANFVRILHDDGTFSLYAHLNWNSIRVKPGDHVQTGDYIADSGNTGFSSGPHLHFAVQRNTGMQIETVPVAFRGPGASAIVPKSGEHLRGHH